MFKWFRPAALDPLSVSMAGAKMGDRVLVIGCGDARLIAALAIKAGLSGRTCAVDESPDLAEQAGRIALKEGALVETSAAPAYAQPFERESFDLVVVRNLATNEVGDPQSRGVVAQEAWRVLRPGGRLVVIDTIGRGGITAILGGPATPEPDRGTEEIEALKGLGFVAVRVLAERDGLRFVEAIKKNG